MVRYVSVVETAKLVRNALKKAFPGTKFSVRSKSYAGGASIDVRWTNGPTEKEVTAIVNPYKGGGFDGMIDMKYHVSSYLLPDGSATFGRSSGTEGSMGMVAGYEYEKPEGAEEVHFGADYIFCDRDVTADVVRQAVNELAELWGFDATTIEIVDNGGSAYLKNGWNIPVERDKGWDSHWNVQTQVNLKLAERSFAS